MVLFSTEKQKRLKNGNGEPFLIITTNEITNEILNLIDTDNSKHIAFQVPLHPYVTKRDLTFDFKVDIWEWNRFVKKIEYLEFRGQIVNNQLTAKHFEAMENIRGLYIGSTNYALFENEDVSNLPLIEFILLNGYGLVITSENMEKWLEKAKLNGCVCERCY
jgi:hypothetical protein